MKKVKFIICLCLAMSFVGCGKKDESSYYCDEGTLNGDKCEIIATKEATLTCDEGYTIQDNQCVKETKADAESSKTCESGYTLSGNQCVSDKDYEKVSKQVCKLTELFDKGDFTWIGGKKDTSEAYIVDGKCFNSTCARFIDGECYDAAFGEVGYQTETSCPSDTKEINGKCKKTASPKTDYTCETGTLDGKKCIISETKEANGSCEDEDYTYNTESHTCEKKSISDAKKK